MGNMKSEKNIMSLPEGEGGHNLQILSDNIPGGMFSCRFDEKLTLLQMNKDFYPCWDIHGRR